MPHVTLLGMSHELSSFHNEKIICPCCWFKVEWVAGQIQRQKVNFEFLEKKLLYPAPWIWIDFAFQSAREKNRRRWVQGVMVTRSEVYWKSQTKSDTYGRAPSQPHLSPLHPQCEVYAWHLVCSIYIYLVEERLPLSCMLKWFLKDSKPLLPWHICPSGEAGRDWEDIG